MHIRRALIIFIALICCCTACSGKDRVTIEKQSYVRWYENENELEVYVVASNPTKHDVSFQASFVFLDEKLREAVGLEFDELKMDDRNNSSPFHLISFNETVFQRTYKTHSKLTREMLSKGVGLQITDEGETYTIPIKNGDIKP